MLIDPVLLATMTGFIGAIGAMCWSYLMASKVAAPRAKRLIVSALTTEGAELQAVRDHLINPALQAQYAAFTERTASGSINVASEVESAVNEALGAFNDELGPTISNHVLMAIRQEQAQQTKSLQAQMEELGIGGVIDEAKGFASDQLPPQLVQAQRLLGMKVSKKYASEHPIEAQVLEAGKLWVMQMMQGGFLGGGQHAQSQSTESAGVKTTGFGVR